MKALVKISSLGMMIVLYLHGSNLNAQSDFWTRLTEPTGGTVRSIAMNSSGKIFLGTVGSGMYASTNGGASWDNIGLYEEDVRTIAIHSNGKMYVGTASHGIFESGDEGRTWTGINDGITNASIWKIGIAPNGDLYAAASGVMFRSTNSGKLWTPNPFGHEAMMTSAIAFHPSGAIFTSGTSGLLRSTDFGKTWESMYSNLFFVMAVCIDRTGRISIGGTLAETGETFKYSTDLGVTWMSADHTIRSFIVELVIARNGDLYGIGDGTFIKSSDKGESWKRTDLGGISLNAVCQGAANDIFMGTPSIGLLKSSDGGTTWATSNLGLNNINVSSLLVNRSNQIFLGTIGHGLFRSDQLGYFWYRQSLSAYETALVSLVMNSRGDLYAANSNIYRSTDNGAFWIRQKKLGGSTGFGLTIDHRDYLFGASDATAGINRSTDNGGTWTKIANQLVSVRGIIVSRNNHIYAGTLDSNFYRSTDDGVTWTPLSLPKCRINSFYFDRAGFLYAATSLGIFRSNDSSDVWTPKNDGIANPDVMCFVEDRYGTLYIGSRGGVLATTNNGDLWTYLNGGLLHRTVRALAIDSGGYLYAGTERGGMYRSVKTTIPLPISPTIVAPTNQETCQPSQLTIQWNTSLNASDYRLQLSYDPTFFTQSLMDTVIASQTSCRTVPLLPNTFFYWRVRAQNNGGSSAWTISHSFKTGPRVLDPPRLDYPSNAATNEPFDLRFRWTAVTCGDRYRLQIARDSTFVNSIILDDSTLQTSERQIQLPAQPDTFYWRVQAFARNIPVGDWSEVRKFSTMNTTALRDAYDQKRRYTLLRQNYPNPFGMSSPSSTNATTISFFLPEANHASLKIFDALGRELMSLIDGVIEQGNHSVILHGYTLPFSGSEFMHYRLLVGDQVLSKRMMFLR